MSARGYLRAVRRMLGAVLDGVIDSLRLPSTLVFFLSSVTVRRRTAQCFMLNGAIFLGSILLADFLLGPLIRAVLAISGSMTGSSIGDKATAMPLSSASIPLPSATSDNRVGEWLNVILLYAYQLLWIYPLYALSFILNAIW
jgi:etoposide-induced 2.4 mRNA